jgi:DNA adenine methylase
MSDLQLKLDALSLSVHAGAQTTTHTGKKQIKTPKPFLKWVGGKQKILNTLLTLFPSKINNYYEPFVGGGSVLFGLLEYCKQGKITITGQIYACDSNVDLIKMYCNIQTHYNELCKILCQIIEDFNLCTGTIINRHPTTLDEAKTSRESYYYWLRQKYNSGCDKTSVEASALFIFINKTCFRGVHRVGPNGFNVPYGHYHNPAIFDKSIFDYIYELIQGVNFICQDYTDTLKCACPNDFVYLDPPYVPESQTSFVGYNANGFVEHTNLFKLLHELTTKNIKFILSNSAVQIVLNEFLKDEYTVMSLLCKRAIHSKNPGATAVELVITNF